MKMMRGYERGQNSGKGGKKVSNSRFGGAGGGEDRGPED